MQKLAVFPGPGPRDCLLWALGRVSDLLQAEGEGGRSPSRSLFGGTPCSTPRSSLGPPLTLSWGWSDTEARSYSVPLLSANRPLISLSELSEERELVAETLKKGTLVLLKNQVREPGLLMYIQLVCSNFLHIQFPGQLGSGKRGGCKPVSPRTAGGTSVSDNTGLQNLSLCRASTGLSGLCGKERHDGLLCLPWTRD